MAEYTIEKIGDVREWKNPMNGATIYYINVTLEGHDKEVSIGKKSADALSIGEVVNGEIIPTDYGQDKWKHAQETQHLFKGPKAADNKYLKDITDLPARFIQSLLPYYDVQSLAKNKVQYAELIALAGQLAEDAKKLIDHLREDD